MVNFVQKVFQLISQYHSILKPHWFRYQSQQLDYIVNVCEEISCILSKYIID